jgi:hypothetical protein
MMVSPVAPRPLRAHVRVLDDGRRVTLRPAVPSDAPRLAPLGTDFDGTGGVVALDDHGAIVGHAGVASGLVVSDAWKASGLVMLLADQRHKR